MKINSDFIKIQKQLRVSVWNAMEEFKMIANGDKVMVCISGGKDSYTMLDMLIHFQKYSWRGHHASTLKGPTRKRFYGIAIRVQH